MGVSLQQAVNPWGSPTLQGFDTNNIEEGGRVRGSNRQFVRFSNKKFARIMADKVQINPKTGDTKVLTTKIEYVEREMVFIKTPGDPNEVEDFAQDYHRREHWQHYKAFREGRAAPLGTSVDECDFIPPSVATELKYRGVYTREQLADASDFLCDGIPNGWTLRSFAQAMAEADKENKSLAQVNALKTELNKSNAIIKQMQEQMTLLMTKQGVPFVPTQGPFVSQEVGANIVVPPTAPPPTAPSAEDAATEDIIVAPSEGASAAPTVDIPQNVAPASGRRLGPKQPGRNK